MRVKACPNRLSASEDVSEDEGPSNKPTPIKGTEIFLEIDGQQIKCTKEELIQNSGYFQSMFSHEYLESTKKVIKVQDNEFFVFFHLINLARDAHHQIPDNELISVLKNAFIFQFDKVVDQLIKMAKTKITPSYSFLIMKEELPFDDLNMRAKFKALISFQESRTSDYLLQLNLRQICEYLGSVFLKCNNELDVFETAMLWYSFNSIDTEADDILKLLLCLNYNNIDVTNLTKIMVSEHVSESGAAQDLIKCIISIKSGDSLKEGTFKTEVFDMAKKMVNSSKNRRSTTSLCVVLDSVELNNTKRTKAPKSYITTSNNPSSSQVTDVKVGLYYGKYSYII